MTNVNLKKEPISNAEWRVMRIIWSLGSATTAEVIENLDQQEDWQPSTVKTLMRRLENKGYLTDDGVVRGRSFAPLISESAAMLSAGDDLFSSMCAMKKGMVLTHLVEDTDISKSDIDEMITILTAKKIDAPDMVACDCLPGKGMACK